MQNEAFETYQTERALEEMDSFRLVDEIVFVGILAAAFVVLILGTMLAVRWTRPTRRPAPQAPESPLIDGEYRSIDSRDDG